MKKTILAIAGLTVFSTSLVALAGPDWQVIERTRAAAHAKVQKQPVDNSSGMPQMCQDMMRQQTK
ncbi:hypothetical protein ACNRBS_01230 [Ralstonia pseudosolanacearum]|uniref:hypothetical protein n=1 Tax=Ralstonia pseudosolanacearum TaxID=1310165 RepID=UPI003AAE42EF